METRGAGDRLSGAARSNTTYDIHAQILDQPAAALIRDLNPDGFTCWMTGAGVKPGVSHGRTDDLGQKAIEDIHPLYHFNATILHLLGLDFEKLSFVRQGN